MKPIEFTSENINQVFQNLYGSFPFRRKNELKIKLKVGDTVRLSKLRGVFDKRYQQSFTDEIFTVSQVIPRIPPVFKINIFDGESIKGTFYEAELQKITIGKEKLYHNEKILKQEIRNGLHYCLV